MILNCIYIYVFTCFINVSSARKYNNYTLLRAIPVNTSHLEFFTNLEKFYDINYWRRPGQLHRAVDFVINPKDHSLFLRDAERHGVYLTTIINDIQTAFDKQTVKRYIRRNMDSFDWENYYRLDDIYQWLTDLEKKYPEEVTLETIGQSHENRSILAVRILHKGGADDRPKIIIEGGIHAREWIAPAFVTYLINEILNAKESTDETLKLVAFTYEWYFVPVLNVDGYEYTHTDDRLWRKNRNGNGVDLNRNFNYAFGTVGVSKEKNSILYCGEKAFSEKESRAMAHFVTLHSKRLLFYVGFHAYGQYMILPYTNSKKHKENYDEMYNKCKRAAKKIVSRYDTKYEIGTAFETIGYRSSGVSGCWVKSTFKVPYVVIIELRDRGYDGFALPPTKILPTCQETMDGLLELFYPQTSKFNHAVNAWIFYKVSAQITVFLNLLLFIVF